MVKIIEIETRRLKLRQWKYADLPVFAEINSNPEVMKYFPNMLSEEESNQLATKLKSLIEQKGWGFWAVERASDEKFLGFVGLNEPGYKIPVSPCIEIGWRLGKEFWGKGYASEAAKASLDIAFDLLQLTEVYSFISIGNTKSRSVMERIGMINTGCNFGHPVVPENHPLKEHVLYKLERSQWER